MFKHFFPVLLFPLVLIGAGCSQAEPTVNVTPLDKTDVINATAFVDGTYALDVDASTVGWFAEKRIGSSHNGTVDAKSGSLAVEEGVFTKGEMTVDMQTIVSLDDNGGPTLDAHLKSEDFFGVENHPEAIFTMTGFEDGVMVGTMTIKDIENEISFIPKLSTGEDKIMLMAEIILDRSRWNVRYGSESFFDNLGDGVIEDEFTLNLDLVFASEMADDEE